MSIDRHEVAVFQNLAQVADTVNTADSEFSRDSLTLDQYSTAAYDSGACERDQVRHCWPDRLADEHLSLSKPPEVAAPANAANRTAPVDIICTIVIQYG